MMQRTSRRDRLRFRVITWLARDRTILINVRMIRGTVTIYDDDPPCCISDCYFEGWDLPLGDDPGPDIPRSDIGPAISWGFPRP